MRRVQAHEIIVFKNKYLYFFVTASACAASAHAQDYPNRPIRLLTATAAGSGSDVVARIIGGKLTEVLGKQIVVDNRASAGPVRHTGAPADGGRGGHHFHARRDWRFFARRVAALD